jgi:hypothetical protein
MNCINERHKIVFDEIIGMAEYFAFFRNCEFKGGKITSLL